MHPSPALSPASGTLTGGRRGRFAPSPTGALHLGGAATFLVAWLDARSSGSSLVMRTEDIDRPRVIPGSEASIFEDLRWLGLDWDEGPDLGGRVGPYRQSERQDHYDRALTTLAERGMVYLCDCSRSEIARASSAPHAGEEGPPYPGTCRPHGMRERPWKRPPAWRFAVPPGREVYFADRAYGEQREIVSETVGDFVLRRGDGVVAYQLAVVVDDWLMGVQSVVRGADLLGSTARQRLLYEALGGDPPMYLHTPLVVGPDGARLAKRSRGVPVADQRAVGRTPGEVLGALATCLGLQERAAPCSVGSLLGDYAPERLRRGAVPLPLDLLVLLATWGVVGSPLSGQRWRAVRAPLANAPSRGIHRGVPTTELCSSPWARSRRDLPRRPPRLLLRRHGHHRVRQLPPQHSSYLRVLPGRHRPPSSRRSRAANQAFACKRISPELPLHPSLLLLWQRR